MSKLNNKIFRNILFGVAILLMITFPVYKNVQYGGALSQYSRQKDFLAGNMMFYNPWQYRILCPLLNLAFYEIYTNTIDKIIKIERYFPDKNPEMVRYFVVFSGFRVLLHLIIYWLCFRFYYHFIHNKWLIYFGLAFFTLSMGNAVYDSDFSFNNYVDVILYLSLALIFIEHHSPWWLLLLASLGALNRETALLIPFLYWTLCAFEHNFQIPVLRINIIIMFLFTLFITIFVGIRIYYGYHAPEFDQANMGFDMLRLNLLSAKSIFSYFEVFGTLNILPFWCLYHFKKSNRILQISFWSLIPIWFAVHYSLVVAWESRLFLVPTALVFLPMTLQTLEDKYLIANS